MCGLGGAENRKCARHCSQKQIFEASKKQRVMWARLQSSGPDRLWGHFGVTLGSVWVSAGDFGSGDGNFAMIVEALWVYEGAFSKNTHFPHRF